MLFSTKFSLELGQVLREFIPVFSIQAERHICHKLVKTRKKPLVLVWWLQNDSRKVNILRHEIIATSIANRIRKKNAICVDCTRLVNSPTLANLTRLIAFVYTSSISYSIAEMSETYLFGVVYTCTLIMHY